MDLLIDNKTHQHKALKMMDALLSLSDDTTHDVYQQRLVDFIMDEPDTTLSRDEIHQSIGILLDKIGTSADDLFLFLSGSDVAVRNKAQLVSRFHHGGVASDLLANSRFREGIERGDDIRKCVEAFPLAQTSKKAANKFFFNLDMAKHFAYGVDQVFHTERGPSEPPYILQKINWDSQENVKGMALLATLPEAPFQKDGEERNIGHMWRIISQAPHFIPCMEARIQQVREGKASMKDALTWTNPFLKKDSYMSELKAIGDAGRIAMQTYYDPISDHISLHYPDGSVMSSEFRPHPYLEDFNRQIVASGEYRDLIRASERAHAMLHETYKRSKPEHDASWKACLPTQVKGNLSISAITSNNELTQEGKELNHCVGSYLTSVIKHHSYILSLTINGQRASTIELSGEDADELTIVQHQAIGNTEPSLEESRFAKEVLTRIKSGEIPFDFRPCAGLEEAMKELTHVEREEMRTGIAFSREDVIFPIIDEFQIIAPQIDLWETLSRYQHKDNHEGLQAFRQRYEHYLEEKAEMGLS